MRGPVTIHDIEVIFTRFDREVGPGSLELVRGNKAAGRAWRLLYNDEQPFLGLDHGFLGWTKREAYRTLEGLLAGWLASTRHWGAKLANAEHRHEIDAVRDEMLPPTEF